MLGADLLCFGMDRLRAPSCDRALYQTLPVFVFLNTFALVCFLMVLFWFGSPILFVPLFGVSLALSFLPSFV